MSDDHWTNNPFRLYRDTAHGRVAGVCAGLGAYFQIKPKYVRLAVIVGACCGFFVPIAVAYLVMALLLKPMPDKLFESPQEEQFWRGVRVSPNQAVRDLKRRFRAVDRRVAEMEQKVTSDAFDLNRRFRDLNA